MQTEGRTDNDGGSSVQRVVRRHLAVRDEWLKLAESASNPETKSRCAGFAAGVEWAAADIAIEQPAPCSESSTWPHVLWFARLMESKLEKNRHKGDRAGWINDKPVALADRINQEWLELMDAIENGASAQEISEEAADVANFCMMVADWFTERAKSPNDKLRHAAPDARNATDGQCGVA